MMTKELRIAVSGRMKELGMPLFCNSPWWDEYRLRSFFERGAILFVRDNEDEGYIRAELVELRDVEK